jgi:hypothetical protein
VYATPNVTVVKSRKMSWAGHIAHTGDVKSTYTILEGKRPLGRPRSRWEDNIRMDLREIVWEVVDWMLLTEDMDQWQTPVNTVNNFRVP